jgi:hypothetical protein
MDPRHQRLGVTLTENAALAKLGLADPWLSVCINARIEGPNAFIGRPTDFVLASFLIPSAPVARLISEVDSRVAELPGVVSRSGGSISLVFEESHSLRRMADTIETASGDDYAPSGFSQFGERKIWLLPTQKPDLFGGAGLCVSYSAQLKVNEPVESLRQAMAIETAESLAAALAHTLTQRFSLGSTPDLSVCVGQSTDSRNWHEGIPDMASSAWRSLSERLALHSESITLLARSARAASL